MSVGLARLALLGSRKSWGRLAGIVTGIAVGTAAFMLLAGAFQALQVREDRSLWASPNPGAPFTPELTDDVAGVASVTDHYGDRDITRLDIAATPTTAVTVPGMGAPPQPGTYYASPAMVDLVESRPAAELGDRFGELAGVLPDDVLVGPDTLVAVIGQTPEALAVRPGATVVTGLVGTAAGARSSYQMIVGVGAIGVFFPVLLFVSIVTQLGAARRAERFATLRLIGASPAVVRRLVAVETFATAVIGTALGVGLGWLLRPVGEHVALDGATFFAADLVPPLPVLLGAPVLIVLGTTLAATRRLRRSGVGPLGATREVQEPRPRALRLVPLLLGLAMLAGLMVAVRERTAEGAPLGFLLMMGGFLMTTLGVVVAGPWLTYQVSAVAARRARSAEAVIAGSRVLRHPVATFRSVSGLVVAVFTVTVFAVAATSATPYLGSDNADGLMPDDALVVSLPAGTSADQVLADASATPGVTGAALLYRPGASGSDAFSAEPVLARADDVATLGLGPVPGDGAVMTAFKAADYLSSEAETRAVAEPATDVAGTDGLLPVLLVVRTAGDTASLETVRTALGAMTRAVPETRAEFGDVGSRHVLDELSFLAYAGALFSIAIAGCSLAVATAAAMLDRRRVLGLLRLVGMPATHLRRIVALEAAAPLLAVLGVSVALGAGVAWSIVESVEDGSMSVGMPDGAYLLTLLAGCALALAMVAAASSTIRHDTAVSSTRFE